MISDERLREAAQKVEESMLASLPDPEECKVPLLQRLSEKWKSGPAAQAIRSGIG